MPYFSASSETISFMNGMWLNGANAEAISAAVGCSLRTVNRWIQQLEIAADGGELPMDRRHLNAGRPPKLSDQQLEMIIAELQDDPHQPASRLLNRLNLNIGPNALRENIRKRSNLKLFKAAKKSELLLRHAQARLEYAYHYVNWTPQQWKPVIVMDEKVFSTCEDGELSIKFRSLFNSVL